MLDDLRRLAQALLEDQPDAEVVLFDLRSSAPLAGARVHVGDLTRAADVDAAVRGAHLVYHIAAYGERTLGGTHIERTQALRSLLNASACSVVGGADAPHTAGMTGAEALCGDRIRQVNVQGTQVRSFRRFGRFARAAERHRVVLTHQTAGLAVLRTAERD